MGKIRKHKKAKLIVGLFCAQEDLFSKAETILSKEFGPVDFQSGIIPFDHTTYYQKEFGSNLKRKFVSFKKLIAPETLPDIKLFTNTIEGKFSFDNRRRVNIDPGYLNDAKVVLASTKDFTHRLYIDKEIFAEVTLYYKDNTFHYWPWTFFEYRTEKYVDIFNQIRKIYLRDIEGE